MEPQVQLLNQSKDTFVMSVAGPQGTQYLGTLYPNKTMNVQQSILSFPCFQNAIHSGKVIVLAAGAIAPPKPASDPAPVLVQPPVVVPSAAVAPTERIVTSPLIGAESKDLATGDIQVISGIGSEGKDYIATPGVPPIQGTVSRQAAGHAPGATPAPVVAPATPVPAAGMIIQPQLKRGRGRPPKNPTPEIVAAAAATVVANQQGTTVVQTPFGSASGALPVQPPSSVGTPPLNPKTGLPMWVQVNGDIPVDPMGYMITPAPGNVPGQAVMSGVSAMASLSNPQVQEALRQATDAILAEVEQQKHTASSSLAYGSLDPAKRLAYINAAQDPIMLAGLLKQEQDGRLTLVIQQKIKAIEAVQAAAAEVMSPVPVAAASV